MAAISEANANRDEAALKEQDLQWHRDQLSKLREQLLEAQRELGRIHILMGSMVQKSVVDEMQAAADLQQEAAMSLRESLRSLQNEKAALELLMQVRLQCQRLLRALRGPLLYSVSDVGLVGDLFKIIPELQAKLT